MYPDFLQNGLLFLHNKFVLTIEALLDMLNTLKTSGSLIHFIQERLRLLFKLEGMNMDDVETSNISKNLEKFVIGVASLLVSESDLNSVSCLLCGNCPPIVSTDGNTKDSIKVSHKMIYDYDDMTEIPDFSLFKDELIEELLCSAMFQHKSNKKFNMLKIPVLMPPKLMGRKVNSESSKKTIMEKEYSYSEETLLKFQELVEKGSLKIGRLGDLTKKELDALGATLGLASKKKSGEFLKLDLINLSNIFLGGQVIFKFLC